MPKFTSRNFLIYLFRHHYTVPFLFFLIFTSIFFSSTVGGMNSGDGSQYALTQAISEDKSFMIDKYSKWTYNVDYALIDSHYYLDREPGLSILAVPFYLTAKKVVSYAYVPYHGIAGKSVDEDSKIQAFTYLTTAMIGAGGLSIFYLLLRQFNLEKSYSIFTTVTAGIGTLMWKYSSSFFREPVFTSFLLLSLLYLFTNEFGRNKHPIPRYIILAGISFGIAILTDYSKIYLIPLLLVYLLISTKKEFRTKTVLNFFLGLFPPTVIIMFYNSQVFHNIFANPHLYKSYFIWMRNPNNLFQTPLWTGLLTNLFSTYPISPSLLKFYWSNPVISHQMGAEWATIHKYNGIFIQTPLLFVSVIGWVDFFKKHTKKALLLISIISLILIVNSKLTIFWATNMYDTRYFLPAVVLLLVGLPFFFRKVKNLKPFLLRLIIIINIGLLLILTLWNGWFSNITNFAPHVTGEHRFNPQYTILKMLAGLQLSDNLKVLFINTFPNIYNLPIMAVIYFIPLSILYLFYVYYNYHKDNNLSL